MAIQDSSKERKERFRAMSSDERKALIREKMKLEGLQEGSGVSGKDLSSYDRDEIYGDMCCSDADYEDRPYYEVIEMKV